MKKYKIIYADPPWEYDFSPKAGSAIQRHYPTMKLEDICNLPVKDICDESCFLFLWTSMPKIEEALQVLNAWGFTYKTTAFVWIKNSKQFPNKLRYLGLGSYTRANAEIVLLGRKGKENVNRRSKNVEQVLIAPRGKHSEKPALIREKIVELLGDLPRIELFAREKIKCWDSWGNELTNDIQL